MLGDQVPPTEQTSNLLILQITVTATIYNPLGSWRQLRQGARSSNERTKQRKECAQMIISRGEVEFYLGKETTHLRN